MSTMMTTITTTALETSRPTTERLTELLTGLGIDAEHLGGGIDLAIDQFDQWTNPRGTALATTTGIFGTDIALKRAA